jgi:hypothetical protein
MRFHWGTGLASGVESLLVETSHSLVLLLIPSLKICKNQQKNMKIFLVPSELEILHVVEGESLLWYYF